MVLAQASSDRAQWGSQGAMSKERRDADALHSYALREAGSGRLDKAERLLRQAIRTGGRSSDTHADLGRVYNLLGRHEEALQAYHKALAIDPDHGTALLNLAGTLL